MSTAPEFTVRVAHEADRRAALELAMTPLAPSARGPLLDTLTSAPPHPLGPLDALVVAVDIDNRVRAACWAQPTPGRAAAFWPVEWAGQRPTGVDSVESELATLALQRGDAAGVSMTQTLFEQGDDPRGETLVACGFVRLAELIYLGRSVIAPEPLEPDEPRLSFEPYCSQEHARMKRVLQQTYVDSLDCPGIEGLRELEDVLLGYRSTGRHNPDYWRFVVKEGADIGVLLLTEHPDSDQAELIYVGLIPEARRRGYGGALLNEAMGIANQMGAEHLIAAVDTANFPARKAYERAGYSSWARRHVLVRRLGGGPIA